MRSRLTGFTLALVVALAALALVAQRAAADTSASYSDVVFADGFESGSLAAWDGTTGSGLVGASGAAAHAGSFGVRMTNVPGQFGVLIKQLPSALKDSSVSFWVRIGAGGGFQTVAAARDQASSQTMWGLLYDGSRQGFYFYPFRGGSSTEVFTGAGSAPAGSWIKVEVQYKATAAGGAQLYLNGQTQSAWGVSGDYTRGNDLQRLQLWDDTTATTDFDEVTIAGPAAAPPPAPTAPGAPTGVQGTPGDGSVNLNWTAPSSDGGSPISGYRITPYIGTTAQTPITTTTTTTSRTITGLTNGTAYTFKVAATNNIGTGPDSNASPAITPTAPASNPIQAENNLAGDPNWGDFAEPPTPAGLSGYGSRISVNHGQSLDLYVTTTAANVKIDVFRMGWYGGAGARLVRSLGTFAGVNQPQARPDATTGMVAEQWTRTTTLDVPSSWTTGVYLARLEAGSWGATIFFVVRDDGGSAPIMFQASVNTYQAYNVYGGTSLYNNNTDKSVFTPPHATKVSFDRPFLNGDGAGQFLPYEYPFVRWIERQGYNVSYTTDVDTSANTDPLTHRKAFLSVGHDEYWSKAMRDNVEGAIAAGVNVAFFAGNESYWQVRFEPNSGGVPNRVLVAYRDLADCSCTGGPDPVFNVNNSLLTTVWRDPRVGRPEEAMMGVMFGGEVNNASYTVKNASHWIYTGTGWTEGTKVPGIVGYEYDHYFGDAATPANTTVVAATPVVNTENNQPDVANSTIYRSPSGAWVFGAGTIQWSWGLDNFGGNTFANAGIQRVTSNILDAFNGTWTPPGA